MYLNPGAAIRCGLLLAACVGAVNASAGATMNRLEPLAARPVIYVANAASNSITIYPDAVNNPAPIGSITAGVSKPQGVSVDYAGNLYVANGGSNTVSVYHPGKRAPYLTYSAGISAPSDVTSDKQGTVYVANQNPPSIVEFARGSLKPTAIIGDVQDPSALALDRNGNLFVTDISPAGGPSRVLEYAPGSLKGQDLGISLQHATGIAFDPGTGDLYVADQGAGAVYGFHQPFATRAHRPSADTPFVIIQVSGALHIIWILTTPAVAVSQEALNEISVFAFGQPKQTGLFARGLAAPTAVTLSQRLF
jgi:DNA-binding beta-propeller fold protein YncE